MIVALLLAGCGPDCDEAGALCTVAGASELRGGERIGVGAMGPEGADALGAALYWPSDVTATPGGEPYVVDWNNHRLVQLAADGTIRVISGGGMVGDGPMDAPASEALWNHPTNIALAGDGTFVFAAWHNSRVVGVDPDGDWTWHVAGNGARGFGGDGGPAVLGAFDLPSGVAFGADGRLYVADQANYRVRCIDPDGTLRTVVGTGEAAWSGDGGPALEAALWSERSQDADPSGRIAVRGDLMVIADTGNRRLRVVDLATMTIDTLAGSGLDTPSVEGEAALSAGLGAPRDVAVGPDGAVYYADSARHCVRRVQAGVVTTVAGVCGEPGYDRDGLPAATSHLRGPFGLDVDDDGTLWIADTFNHAIRRVVLE